MTRDGSPVAGLKADQFEVFVDGRKQPIVNLEFIRIEWSGGRSTRPPASCTGSEERGPHDRPRDRPGELPGIGPGVGARSGDAGGKHGRPGGQPRIDPVPWLCRRWHRLATTRPSAPRSRRYQDSAWTWPPRGSTSRRWRPLGSRRGTPHTKEITDRECKLDPDNRKCPNEVVQDGGRIADALERQAQLSISGLRGVLDTVGSLPGRKTLMLISAGLPMNPRGKPNPDSETAYIAQRAAAFNINLYVFYMNVHFLKAFSADTARGTTRSSRTSRCSATASRSSPTTPAAASSRSK